ncbi:MAG TPA: FkbM family methyltransferase [Gemmatimonadales bacterium]|jgi:FkbM family methyltransferase
MRDLLIALVQILPASWLRRVGAWQWTGPLARRLVGASSDWIRRQDVIISHGVGRGLRFNAAGANPGYALGTSEPEVQELIASLVKIREVVYDIGANVGFYTVLCGRLVGPGGAVFAFEPLAETARAAKHNAQLNGFVQVTVFDKAVGAKAGTVRMALREESTWARLADASTEGPTITVQMITIDDLVKAGTIRPPDFIKIDVEGAELEVIEGMRETIRAHRPVILCEMHGKNREFAAQMAGLGYEVRPLESELPLAEAKWDVHALATPKS